MSGRVFQFRRDQPQGVSEVFGCDEIGVVRALLALEEPVQISKSFLLLDPPSKSKQKGRHETFMERVGFLGLAEKENRADMAG